MVVGVLGAPPANAAPAAPGEPVATDLVGGGEPRPEVEPGRRRRHLPGRGLRLLILRDHSVQGDDSQPQGGTRGTASRGDGLVASARSQPARRPVLGQRRRSGRSQIDGPALLSPAAGAELVQPTNPPLLSWVPVSGATSCEVEIDAAEGDFIGSTVYSTKTTSLVVPNPQENGTYWWRVRALQEAASRRSGRAHATTRSVLCRRSAKRSRSTAPARRSRTSCSTGTPFPARSRTTSA